jgi:hypothetical protein
LAGTVNVCRVSSSNPKFWVTVGGVPAPAFVVPTPVTMGATMLVARATAATADAVTIRRRRPGTHPVLGAKP